MGTLKRRFFEISLDEASFERRGFRGGNAAVRERLDRIGRCLLYGYHAALESDEPDSLAASLHSIAPEDRGFAFEGAGMMLAILDRTSPWNRGRFSRFLAGPAAPYIYMAYAGFGWAMARLPFSIASGLKRLDPVLCWLAVDGYGFHQGFFHWRDAVDRHAVPRRVRGYGRRAFDQGLGRSLWFVEGTEVRRIARTIESFPPSRHADLWSGIGLACTYAGGADAAALLELTAAAARFRAELAQGAAFAAVARFSAGVVPAHTLVACEILTRRTVEDTSRAALAVRTTLPADDPAEPLYELWRRGIQARLSADLERKQSA
jgi:enediyne biosynthesis protein E3